MAAKKKSSTKPAERRDFVKTLTALFAVLAFAPRAVASAEEETEEHAVARRCVEIYAAEVEKEGDGWGWRYFMEAVDEVTQEGEEGIMLASPLSKFFVPVFVDAVQDIGRDHPCYVRLKELIAQVDAGADLDELAPDYDDYGRLREGGK